MWMALLVTQSALDLFMSKNHLATSDVTKGVEKCEVDEACCEVKSDC